MTLLILFLFLAIGVSFLCSILEAVLLSVSHSYITLLENEGHKDGALLRKLKDDIDKPLATILSLNTIAHTVGAAGVGAQAHVVFGSGSLTIVSAILTLLILFVSEIIPKTLGARYWRQLAPLSARVLKVLIVALYPLVWLSKKITGVMSSEKHDNVYSREEITAMAAQGARDGVLEEKEFHMFKNLIMFRNLKARDVMTPRTVVVSLGEASSIRDVVEIAEAPNFSRIPVYRDEEEDITGFVMKNDMLIEAAEGRWDTSLRDIKRDVLIVPDQLLLKELFDKLMSRREHVAVLVDEYGGLSGIVTLEDIVETLLGLEIMDEVDAIEDMQEFARQKWSERAKRLGLVPNTGENTDS